MLLFTIKENVRRSLPLGGASAGLTTDISAEINPGMELYGYPRVDFQQRVMNNKAVNDILLPIYSLSYKNQ